MALSPPLLFSLPLRLLCVCVQEKWLPDIQQRAIPTSAGVGPLDMLTDESTKASGAAACTLPAQSRSLLLGWGQEERWHRLS